MALTQRLGQVVSTSENDGIIDVKKVILWF